MKLLLIFRCISACFLTNYRVRSIFYNWNYREPDSETLVLQDVNDVANFELGQVYEVIRVNRATGKITLRLL